MNVLTILIIICLFILVFIYLNYENRKVKVSNYNVVNKKIPKDFDDYKIIQISDFHNTKYNKLIKEIIKEIRKQKPNIIVITGDLIHTNTWDNAINLIKIIKDIAPIYYVPGNHEAIIEDYDKFIRILKDNKVNVLNDKVKILRTNKSEINLIGIEDPIIKMRGNINLIKTLKKVDIKKIAKDTLDELTYNQENYSILLSHRPDFFDIYYNSNLDLILTGHAHGGQFRIPFIGGVFAPGQGVFPKYTSGIFNKNNTSMVISRGIGNSTFPFRVNNRPDLVVITLKNSIR